MVQPRSLRLFLSLSLSRSTLKGAVILKIAKEQPKFFKANKRGWSKFLNNLKNIFFDILDYLNDAICDHTLNEFEQFYKSKKPYTGSK